jgi:2-polyprenyl-3-methyl-5-hydroxy-6-metoxy-1,4-benzoquinol methylase
VQSDKNFVCRVCDSERLDMCVDLGMQPWCNHFLTADQVGQEPFYPLRLVYCQDCSTVQLDHTVAKEIMFGDHTYLSGVTRSLSEHFRAVADEGVTRFFSNKAPSEISVLDIGSNDGTQLKHFQALGCEVLGVESSKRTAEMAVAAGVPTLNRYFNLELMQELGRKFDLINAAGVFFHLEELHSAARGIKLALADDGVFIVQFLYMKRIVENLAFDQIYHEHLLYYNLKTIDALLSRHGLAMFDAYLSPIHGGSIIGFVSHKGRCSASARLSEMRALEEVDQANHFETYLRFAERIEVMKRQNLEFLGDRKRMGKSIYGMGAPVKGNTMLNYFGVGKQYLDCLVEKNPLRKGLFSPGMHLPVVMEDELPAPPDVYYVLAWNFKKEILANNQDLIREGVEFFFPVNPSG